MPHHSGGERWSHMTSRDVAFSVFYDIGNWEFLRSAGDNRCQSSQQEPGDEPNCCMAAWREEFLNLSGTSILLLFYFSQNRTMGCWNSKATVDAVIDKAPAKLRLGA